ncbi:flippase [Candidatus Micrarchaeota archaeon]|nr:flippase [Candidatus Micrarchaeota archaeon]
MELSSEKKTMAKGTFWNLTGNLLLKVVSLVYTVLLARLFPQEEVGVFYLALGVMYLAAIFGDMGLNASFRRYFPFFLGRGEKKNARNLLISSYAFTGGLSILIAGGLFLLSGPIADSFGYPSMVPPLQLLSLFLATSTFFGLNCAFLSGLKRMKEANFVNNGQNVLKLLLSIALYYYFGQDAVAMALAFTASYFVFVIVSFYYVKKGIWENGLAGRGIDLPGKVSVMREVLPFGLALALLAEINNVAFYTDRLMMGYLMPVETAASQIAVYSIALSLALFIPVFPGAVSGIFSPIITELYGKGKKEEMEKTARTAARWNIFLLVPITLIMVIFSYEIMGMLYGESYMAGAFVLAAFSVGIFFRNMANVPGTILEAMRQVKVEYYVAGAVVAINLLLNWMLIPVYGMDGAAVASSASMLVAMLMLMHFCRKITGFEFMGEGLKPLLAGLISFALILLLKGHIMGVVDLIADAISYPEGIVGAIAQKLVKAFLVGGILAVTFAVYIACVVLLRGVEREDWELAFMGMGKARMPGWMIDKVKGFVEAVY